MRWLVTGGSSQWTTKASGEPYFARERSRSPVSLTTRRHFIVSLHLKQPGSSMGGQVDQALAVKYPRLVKRLILAATAPGDGKAIPREVSGPAPYRFAAAIPHLELKIDPDAAHGFLVQHITAWVRQFDRFLS
jgi:pimeloyl-ACP methyl ester carboxylesterase